MLAAHLLAGNPALAPVLAAWYVSQTPELRSLMEPVWSDPRLEGVEAHGGAFWMEIRTTS